MTPPTPARLFEVLDATWPAAAHGAVGPWHLRRGNGGGQRVSAATVERTFGSGDIEIAEREMRALDQRPLFMVREGDDALDAALDARGYSIADPTVIYLAETAEITAELPITAVMPSWPPLAIQLELWASGGIGPSRIAVMNRCECRKTSFLGRSGDVPAGTAFVAADADIAMVHAVEVDNSLRQMGVGRRMMQASANWAHDVGAIWLCLAVTRANGPANALYRALGMREVTAYHYRRAPEGLG